jgi:hypothetical protein
VDGVENARRPMMWCKDRPFSARILDAEYIARPLALEPSLSHSSTGSMFQSDSETVAVSFVGSGTVSRIAEQEEVMMTRRRADLANQLAQTYAATCKYCTYPCFSALFSMPT